MYANDSATDEAKLCDSEAKLRCIADASLDAIVMCALDQAGRVNFRKCVEQLMHGS
jgi:hypothetical protein